MKIYLKTLQDGSVDGVIFNGYFISRVSFEQSYKDYFKPILLLVNEQQTIPENLLKSSINIFFKNNKNDIEFDISTNTFKLLCQTISVSEINYIATLLNLN